MTVHWDNIQILQKVDQYQQQYGGGEIWGVDGRQLMDEVAGSQVTDDNLWRGFIRELQIAAAEGFLTFKVEIYPGDPEQMRESNPYYWLQQIRRFALTVAGQDRARGNRVVQPLPNPDEDDGRPISSLILEQIASAIAEEYTSHQVVGFLAEGGIPLDRLPLPEGTPTVDADRAGFVYGVLIGLDLWWSEGRRTLRGFLGAWLDDRMISGPTDDLRRTLIEQLARRGWYVVDGNLVIGELAKGTQARSPVMRDARLAALHPEILKVAEQLFRDGHRAAAVFEAAKAINNRVKAMTSLTGDGSGMMGNAFKDDQPPLALADLTTQTGKDTQAGYRLLLWARSSRFATPPLMSSLPRWTTTRPSSSWASRAT